MSDQQYAIAGVGTANVMRAGYMPDSLIIEIGKYWLPAVAGIMRAGLSRAGDEDGGSQRYDSSDLQVTNSGAGEVSEASFSIMVHEDDVVYPEDGNPVIIGIGTTQNRVFGGYLRIPDREYVTPDRRLFFCRAVSWEKDLERRILNDSWEGQYSGDLLESLLTTYAPDFKTALYVEQGTYLEEIVARDESLLALASRLADVSGYVFYIDPLRNVHFHRPETVTAPFDIEDGQRFGGLKTREDSSQLKTRVIVFYSQLQSKSESFTGDGSTEDFQLAFEPYAVVSLQVNGSDVTYRTHYQGSESVDFSIDYNRGMINTRDHATLENTDTLTIAYTARVPAKLTRNHAAAQLDRASREGGNGIYEYVIRGEQTILSKADARAAADAVLVRDAYPHIGASYTRIEPLIDLLRLRLIPGMQQSLDDFGLADNLTISKVTISVLVPANDTTLQWQQDVELGQPQASLETLMVEAITPATDTQESEISIDEEENYT